MDVSVEGELGTIGGKEEGDTDLEASYTKVSEAEEFVRRTNVSTLAIGVGTAHGVYKGTPHINIERIKEIHAAIDTPLFFTAHPDFPMRFLRTASLPESRR